VLRIVLFFVLSAGIAYVSRASLRKPSSHGFYRFFAWELLLALLFLNFISIDQWFGDPFSIRQLFSWFFLAASAVPALLAVHLLTTIGRPDTRQREDEILIGLEKTTRLVTTGVYKHIRHPIYCSLCLLAWGVFLKNTSWAGSVAALGATAFLLATARFEEKENVLYFGTAYEDYMRRTKSFIPFCY